MIDCSIEFLRSVLLDMTEDALLLIDEAGRLVLSNHAADIAFGLTPDCVGRLSIRELLSPWDETVLKTNSGNPHGMPLTEREATGYHRTGAVIPVWYSLRAAEFGARRFCAVIVRDRSAQRRLLDEKAQVIAELHASQEAALNIMEDLVAQRRQLEAINQALSKEMIERQRSEATRIRLAAIVESSSDAIIGNSLDGVVQSWNTGAEMLYGYAPEEIIAKPLQQLLVPAEYQDEFARIMARIRNGEKVSNLETIHMTRNGERLFVSLTVSPILDETGMVIGASAIARDITRRVTMERELELHRDHLEAVVHERTEALLQSREKLRQSERLASIGALAAGIAHEINNPVGAIMLCSDNAMNKLESMTSLEEAKMLLERTCHKVLGNARRCGLIVKGVLQFSRKEATEKKPADINAIARTSVQLINDSLDLRGSRITCRLSAKIPQCMVNSTEIEQVFVNLIKNAVEATSEEVEVQVSTEPTKNGTLITVADNGPGMSEEQRQRIFDPFYTTRQQQGGTGLGMSIVHGIVVDHQGSIDVESKLGAGTTVTIYLPIAPKAHEDDLIAAH
jgi:PAS domain S-box-containing protein